MIDNLAPRFRGKVSWLDAVPGSSLSRLIPPAVLTLCAMTVDIAPGSAQLLGPDAADPGDIERRIEQLPPRPRKADPGPPRAPDAVAPLGIEQTTAGFVLAAVVIDGATVFEAAELGPLYEEFLAKEVFLVDVEEILARITTKYRDDGYILSRAVAPPQELGSGLLRVQVIEGFIERVSFTGEADSAADLSMYERHLVAARPLSIDRLERSILLINDLPGLQVEPVLRVIDDATGAHELILEAAYDPAEGYAYLDNRGTPAIGRLQTWLSGNLNSPLGLRDRFQLGVFTVPNQPRELVYLEGVYEQPIDNEGTVVSLLASRSWVDAGGDLAREDTESRSSRFSLKLWHPVIRSRDQNLWLTTTLDYRDTEEERFSTTTIDDRLRVLRGRLNYMLSDALDGTSFASVEVSQGLDILDASEKGDADLSRFDGSGDFTKIYATTTRQQALGENFGLQIDIAGQAASRPLLSSEEFAIGGSQFGRAYDIAELTGEHGFAASVELRYGRDVDWEVLQSFQLYGFYDWGAVWNDLTTGGASRDSLSSAGGGLRLSFLPGLSASLEVAVPLTREVFTRENNDPRLFFSINASF